MASPVCKPDTTFLLQVADSMLIHAQRLCEWVGNAPMLEEEMALANISLDMLGQATLIYEHVAAVEGDERSADDFAFAREEREYLNALIVELPNGDFAQTMLRIAILATWACEMWSALATQADDTNIRGIAGKALKEASYHQRHACEWMERLAHGTDESRERCANALEVLWPYTDELATLDASINEWQPAVANLLAACNLEVPESPWMQSGGFEGRHSEHLGFVLAEMQHLQRVHAGATW